jgi:hypothetical protein
MINPGTTECSLLFFAHQKGRREVRVTAFSGNMQNPFDRYVLKKAARIREAFCLLTGRQRLSMLLAEIAE